MSTITATADARPALTANAPRVTWLRVLHSEWIKLSALRSTRITLLVSFALMAGIGAAASAITAANWSHVPPAQRDPVTTVLSGYQFAQLAVGVLGVLVISNEYSSGVIRATLTAVPRRLPVLWAKSALFAAMTLVTMTAASLTAFWAGAGILSARHLNLSLANPVMLRAVVGAGLYLAVVGLLGVALGALLRSTAGAIASLVGLIMLLPILSSLLGSWFTANIAPYLPTNAGGALLASHHAADTLQPWTGFTVMCAWAVAALVLAAYGLVRRDA